MEKNKLVFLFLIILFMVSLSSIGVLAQVPTPADMFSNLGDFFSSLFVGGADWETSYLLTFVLYFIIFMAIFVEGLKYLPFFGGVGEISIPGKWFAFAAAMLATLGIFIGEQVSGRSAREAVAYVAAPWGLWGGLAIAGIIAFISYKLIRDSGLFGEEIMRSAALAVAIGLMAAGWLLSPVLFGWGFLVMLIVLIVGIVTHVIRVWGEKGGGIAKGGAVERPAKAKLPKEKEEKEKKTEKTLGRALRKVYRYNKKVGRNLEKAHKESLNGLEVNINLVRKHLKEAKRYEKREIDFDALVSESERELGELARAEPSLKAKLDALNNLLKVNLSIIKTQIEKAEGATSIRTIPTILVKAKNACEKIRGEILGMEAVVKGLKKEL